LSLLTLLFLAAFPLPSCLLTLQGKPGCLAGTKWVLTGELTRMTRDQGESCIEALGGATVGAPSGRVTHLLIGSCLEDGRDVRTGSKWNKTQELIAKGSKITVLTEDEFYDKVESSLPPAERAAAQAARLGHAAAGKGMEGLDTATCAGAEFGAASKPLLAGVEAGAASSTAIVPASRAGVGTGAGAGAASSRSAAGAGGVAADALWVDRYKPRSFADLVGNQRELQALDGWLRDWESVHLHPHAAKPAGAGAGGAGAAAAPKAAPAAKAASHTGARATAALLSGPPGIGKTTTAMLLAARHGYDVMELNASDTRSKKALDEELTGAVDSTVLDFGACGVRGVGLAVRALHGSIGGGSLKAVLCPSEQVRGHVAFLRASRDLFLFLCCTHPPVGSPVPLPHTL